MLALAAVGSVNSGSKFGIEQRIKITSIFSVNRSQNYQLREKMRAWKFEERGEGIK